MAEIKWIKITTDIFDDEKILLIESLPQADSLIVIWFKLLAFAGRSNNNGVFMLNNKMPYTDEMLATVFRRPLNTVRLALQTFEGFGMIEMMDNVITIPNWEKHQNVDGLDKIREQNRLRKQKQRAKQKQLLLTSGEETMSRDKSREVTQQNEERREKKEDKEIYKNIIDYLNLKTGSKYKPTSKATKEHINARLKEGFTLEDFKTVIDNKTEEWKGTDFEQYLRPLTLFGTKFESYLNTKPKKKASDPTYTFEGMDDLDELF